MLALPAELLNSTIRENYGEITSWLGVTKGKFGALHHAWANMPTFASLAVFVTLGAVLYTFLDPGAGFNQVTAAELIGLIGALGVIAVTHDLARSEYHRRVEHRKARGRLITFPAGIAFAVVLVIVSRVFGFQPGFIFGVVTGIAFSEHMSDKDEGRGLAIASLLVLLVAFVAWFAWIPVKANVEGSHNPAFVMVALDTLLATVWVAGVQSVLFSMIPIRFMDGEKIAKWSRWGWLGIYIFALFVFVHTVLHPTDSQAGGTNAAQIVYLSILLGVLVVASVSAWLFFFFRNRREKPATAEA